MANKSIRFPQIHVAQSTANRILNVASGVPSTMLPGSLVSAPVLPDVGEQGAVLDAQLQTPPADAELPAGADGAVVGSALAGDDLAMAAIDPLLV